MEKFVSQLLTGLAFCLNFITWNGVTQFLAVILTLTMIIYYAFKAWNEKLINKQMRKDANNDNSIH